MKLTNMITLAVANSCSIRICPYVRLGSSQTPTLRFTVISLNKTNDCHKYSRCNKIELEHTLMCEYFT